MKRCIESTRESGHEKDGSRESKTTKVEFPFFFFRFFSLCVLCFFFDLLCSPFPFEFPIFISFSFLCVSEFFFHDSLFSWYRSCDTADWSSNTHKHKSDHCIVRIACTKRTYKNTHSFLACHKTASESTRSLSFTHSQLNTPFPVCATFHTPIQRICHSESLNNRFFPSLHSHILHLHIQNLKQLCRQQEEQGLEHRLGRRARLCTHRRLGAGRTGAGTGRGTRCRG